MCLVGYKDGGSRLEIACYLPIWGFACYPSSLHRPIHFLCFLRALGPNLFAEGLVRDFPIKRYAVYLACFGSFIKDNLRNGCPRPSSMAKLRDLLAVNDEAV